MNNPFESGHIKNYILLYASVVVIMILFFIAATLFRDNSSVKTKVFKTETKEAQKTDKIERGEASRPKSKFKLLDKAY